MKRTIILALIGFVYIFISITLFIPLRMKPIPNYNLFIFPIYIAVFLYLFYKACSTEKESKAYIYAYFAGMLMWQVLGEMSSLRVNEGLILQFSDVNLKTVGGYLFVLLGWIILYMVWKLKALKNPICFGLLIFLGIWTEELYLDNFTATVPLNRMPTIANVLGLIGAALSVWVIYAAKKAATIEKQTVLGGLLYLTFSMVFMSLTLWQKPLTFYLKHERVAIEAEIRGMQEEIKYIDELKKQLGMTDDASITKQLGLGK
jgi:hypothetical protein